MNKEIEQSFYSQYPLLFADKDLSPQETAICHGLTCDDGWNDLIHGLCANIEPKIARWVGNNPNEEHPRLAQVKEKFGGLRFYMVGLGSLEEESRNEIRCLISLAESKSLQTCEECGEIGKKEKIDSLHKTLCTKCYKKRIETC